MPAFTHAVIGCGRVAPNHVDGFSVLPDTTVAWACDRDIERARALAQQCGIPHVTDDPRDVLHDADVDAVSIAVDHAQHARLASTALKSGKHVLLEKPLALDVADGTALVELAQQTGKLLSVVSQHRYDPVVRAVRRWIDDGLLGRLVSSTVDLQCARTHDYYGDSYWRGSWAGEGGSAVINQGYHALDVTRWLHRDLDVVAAAARTAAMREVMETEDTLAAVLRSPDGALVTYNVTVAGVVTWRTRIGVVGTEGSVLFDLDHPGTLHLAEGGAELRRAADALRERGEPPAPPGKGYYGISHRRQIAEFREAACGGVRMSAGAQEGLGTLRLLNRLYEHARTGLPVPDGDPADAALRA
ncbi:Gfo/Idh/MocA family protein [Streptomyces winkii]|uniref:Gfo/Idh/MocA family protein n=1 Tax=Streptomyces winkii TaxID=3051178 RepID=UPI0028D685AF|nr:Gfo/Idh/MocA family oxidoreductase [Streptomyces sp. DSM 40971]